MRAATVALEGVATVGAGDKEEGEGRGEQGRRGGRGRQRGQHGGSPAPPPPPPLTHGSCSVRFHLPRRPLVRPTLVILASGEAGERAEVQARLRGWWCGAFCGLRYY